MPSYEQAVAEYNEWLAGRAPRAPAPSCVGTPEPSTTTTTSGASSSIAVPTTAAASPAPANAAPSMPAPAVATCTPLPSPLFLIDDDEDGAPTLLPATPRSAHPTPTATSTTSALPATPQAADPALPPPYSEVSTPKRAANYAAVHLQRQERHRSRSRATSEEDYQLAERTRVTSTPHTPARSSPLTFGSFGDNGYDFTPVSPLRLPTPPDQRKAYADGRGADIFNSIPGNTGVLASSSDPDFFNTTSGVRVEQDQQRLGVRLSSDNATHLSGEVLTMGHTGSTASAAGPSARVLTINTAQGVATSAYFKGGRAHITIARAPVSPSTSAPPSSPSVPAAAQQAKRRWDATGIAPPTTVRPTTTTSGAALPKSRSRRSHRVARPSAAATTAPAQTAAPARAAPAPAPVPVRVPVPAPTRTFAPVPTRTSAPAIAARASAPATARTSAPATARTSAPATARMSAPATARTSAPAPTRVSAPSTASTSAPAVTRTSAPAPAKSVKTTPASATPSPAPSKRLKLTSGLAAPAPVPPAAPAQAVAPAQVAPSGRQTANTERLLKRVSPDLVLPVDELVPLTQAMLTTLNVTPAGLAGTALANIGVHVLENAIQFSGPPVRLLAHLVVLDHHPDVCMAKLDDSTHFSKYAGDRPAHLALFYENKRRFNSTSFKDFDGMYILQFWTWWDALTEGMRFPTEDYRRPGGLKPGADLTPLMVKGPYGFGSVVAGLLIWVFAYMRDGDTTSITFNTTPQRSIIRQWFPALRSVLEVAAAMVSGLR
jgi:hypothetical protein